MMPCTKDGCERRTFMTTDRCFDHQRMGIGRGFVAWFVFCAIVALTLLAVAVWAVVELVTWVTAR